MTLRNNSRQWGTVAKTFHWLIALAILVNGRMGFTDDGDVSVDDQDQHLRTA